MPTIDARAADADGGQSHKRRRRRPEVVDGARRKQPDRAHSANALSLKNRDGSISCARADRVTIHDDAHLADSEWPATRKRDPAQRAMRLPVASTLAVALEARAVAARDKACSWKESGRSFHPCRLCSAGSHLRSTVG